MLLSEKVEFNIFKAIGKRWISAVILFRKSNLSAKKVYSWLYDVE